MKKVSVTSIVSFILAATSIVCIALNLHVAASVTGLLAYFTALFTVKNETAVWQVYYLLVVSVVFGYAVSPDSYYMIISLIFLTLMYGIRALFIVQLGNHRLPWLEALFYSLAVGTYLMNLQGHLDWMGWAFPASMLAFGLFIVSGMVANARDLSKSLFDQFRVKIGKPAPGFTLPDQDGNMVSLTDFKNKRHVLLVFVRGEWCPTCHIMLRTYEKYKEKFAEKDIMIMAIGPDPVGVNKEMVMRLGVDYKMLSDDKMVVVKLYGTMIQPNNPRATYAEGIPLPAAFLIDKEGTVVFTSNPRKPGEILRSDAIFPVVEKL